MDEVINTTRESLVERQVTYLLIISKVSWLIKPGRNILQSYNLITFAKKKKQSGI